ncbi:glycosyltransferase [Streptomyces sp. 796.1]|uniref:glycosyltransferase n=1 Tax=Streptomyces sp. 796.1 TaxID=3163029 RepID=UPI0039C912DC
MSALTWIAIASLAAWAWLLLGQGWFWRTDVRLPPYRAEGEGPWPTVAVVVPARDEAEVLPMSLPSLLEQDYPGQAVVFLVDDGSSDGTADRARALADDSKGLPLVIASPGEPEPGWTGKLWAVRHGIELARAQVEPEYLLLTDADIAHEPDSLRALVCAARAADLDLVSQMARLRVHTAWERLIVPAFVYFFAQLYPFRWVNRPGARAAAAAGGCVLLRTEAAERARVPESIRQSVIDDVALARAVKRAGRPAAERAGAGRGSVAAGRGRRAGGGRIWLGLAERVDSVRPYPHLRELWQMVARSAYAQLRHNPLLLLGTVLGLAVIYLAPPVAVCVGALQGERTTWLVGAVTWAVLAGSYLPMLRYYRQPAWLAPLLPLIALLYLLMTVDSAVQHYRGRGAAWKGRTYTRPEAAP